MTYALTADNFHAQARQRFQCVVDADIEKDDAFPLLDATVAIGLRLILRLAQTDAATQPTVGEFIERLADTDDGLLRNIADVEVAEAFSAESHPTLMQHIGPRTRELLETYRRYFEQDGDRSRG